VQEMPDSHPWMGEEQARAGEAHDLANVFAAGRRVAVDGALGANGFVYSPWTAGEPLPAVLEQIFTVNA